MTKPCNICGEGEITECEDKYLIASNERSYGLSFFYQSCSICCDYIGNSEHIKKNKEEIFKIKNNKEIFDTEANIEDKKLRLLLRYFYKYSKEEEIIVCGNWQQENERIFSIRYFVEDNNKGDEINTINKQLFVEINGEEVKEIKNPN